METNPIIEINYNCNKYCLKCEEFVDEVNDDSFCKPCILYASVRDFDIILNLYAFITELEEDDEKL